MTGSGRLRVLEGRLATRLVGLAAVALLVAGVVAAATDGGGDHAANDDVVTLLAAAPGAVADRGSARMTLEVEVDGNGFSSEFGGSGAIDFRSKAGQFEMSAAGLKFQMVSDGTTMWVEVPAAARVATDGKAWLATPLSNLESGASTGPFAQVDSVEGFLAALRKVGARVEDRGADDVHGVDAHHYRASVDPAALVTDSTSAALLAGTDEVPLDVWLDDAGLPVRFEMKMTGKVQGAEFHMRMRYELSDFGVAVVATPPPADQVMSVPDLASLQRLLQAAG